MSTWLIPTKNKLPELHVHEPFDYNEWFNKNTDCNYRSKAPLFFDNGASQNGGMKSFVSTIVALTGVGPIDNFYSPQDLLGIADMLEDAFARPDIDWWGEGEIKDGVAKTFRELGTLGLWVYVSY